MLATPRPISAAAPATPRPRNATARLVLVARALVALGPATARLGFAAPAAAATLGRCAALAIRGVAPRRLLRLRVHAAGASVLDLGSVPNGRGGELTAGEMLAAISTMDGHADLVVALPAPAAALQDLRVQLDLCEPSPWSDACIEVHARLV